MASTLPPVKNSGFTFEMALGSQSDKDIFQTSVTLAAGDVKVSKDGGAFANIATLPTEIGSSGVITVTLSSTEMAADRVAVLFHDASGSEWQDALVTIYTAAQSLDTAVAVTIADSILTRDWTAVSGEAARCLLNAVRFLRNKFVLSGTTLTVYKEDDSTPAWTGSVSTDASAEPIISSDPT